MTHLSPDDIVACWVFGVMTVLIVFGALGWDRDPAWGFGKPPSKRAR